VISVLSEGRCELSEEVPPPYSIYLSSELILRGWEVPSEEAFLCGLCGRCIRGKPQFRSLLVEKVLEARRKIVEDRRPPRALEERVRALSSEELVLRGRSVETCLVVEDETPKDMQVSIRTLLRRCGVKFSYLTLPLGCGSQLELWGFSSEAKIYMERLKEFFESRGIKRAIVTSPRCKEVISRMLPEVIPYTSYLVSFVEKYKERLSSLELNLVLLGTGDEEMDSQALEAISSLPGISLRRKRGMSDVDVNPVNFEMILKSFRSEILREISFKPSSAIVYVSGFDAFLLEASSRELPMCIGSLPELLMLSASI